MAAQVETVVSHPPPGADTPRARAVPSLTPDLGQAAAQRQVRNDQSTAGQALAPQSSFSVIADDLPRVTGFVGQGAGQVTANHGQVSGAGDGISPVDLWAAVPLPYANVTVWPSPQAPGNESEARQEPATAPAPLSAEQIDQILDALDERLELMLLRMYGTSTF